MTISSAANSLPLLGQYFPNISPVIGQPFTGVARSTAEDIEKALDAAHAAKDGWGKTSPTERSNILLKIADRMEAKMSVLALAETIENGKPIRETMAADLRLAIDHFRYFAGAIRAQESGLSQIDNDTVAYHFNEPLGDDRALDHAVRRAEPHPGDARTRRQVAHHFLRRRGLAGRRVLRRRNIPETPARRRTAGPPERAGDRRR